MRKRTEKWYEVTYSEGGYVHQQLSRGRREMMALHKHYPGSTLKTYTKFV